MAPSPRRDRLLSPSALNSPRPTDSDYPPHVSSQSSSYSRRASATTIPISELSSRRPSFNTFDDPNSAYNSPAAAPLLGGAARTSTTRQASPRWSKPTDWRRLTWIKVVFWVTPFTVLLVVLLHESVAKLRQQINAILRASSSPSYSCPSPLLGRTNATISDLDMAAFTPFTTIETNHSAFSIALSYSTTRCNSFKVRIARRNPVVCLRNMDRPFELNEDDATAAWIKSLGPDTFQLRVDGAERFVVDEPSRYDPERCEYFFDFPLVNAGTVWLNGIHFYENYDAYDSTPHHTIDRRLVPLFATPLQLSLCPSSSCSPYVPPLLASPPSAFLAPHERLHHPRLESLPICAGRAPIKGSYVPSALPSFLYPPFQLPQTPTRPSAGLFQFVPNGCRFSHDGLRFRPGHHASCLERDNRVLFIGDSHTRGLYDVILKRLNGSDEMALTSFKVANKRASIGNLHLEFLWDPFLEASFDCSYMSQFTHVVVSSGSHQACYRCPPTTAYVDHMSSIFHSWPTLHSQCEGTSHSHRPNFVFVTNPAWYPQRIEKFDCRTSQRLTRWNELTTQAALEHGWGVVDAQSYSRAIAIDTRMIDGVHYIKTDAIDPMVDELIMKLDICPDTYRALIVG
ncbi:uncharacterized protein JCM15063_001908 [Sporobolomyces koalae]|uniref:uncharacterized protein n=1 Tax=Sporobolomyces koalae TaxID=500713 RepID=UPI00316B1643